MRPAIGGMSKRSHRRIVEATDAEESAAVTKLLQEVLDAEQERVEQMESKKTIEALRNEVARMQDLMNRKNTTLVARTLEKNIAAIAAEVEKLVKKTYSERLEAERSKTIKEFNIVQENESKSKLTSEIAVQKKSSLLSKFKENRKLALPDVQIVDETHCKACGSTNLRHLLAKSSINCLSCGHSFIILDTTTGFSEDIQYTSSFSYMRSNHFNDWLLRIQAKESYVVDDETIREVMMGLHDRGIEPKDVNQFVVLDVMKKKRLKSRAYNHAAQICTKITGKPPPRLTSEQDELAKLIFHAIQEPFAKHAPQERKNFLSYAYCLYRILQLVGADALLENISLLSGRGKIAAQDRIMRKIYVDLDIDWPGDLEDCDTKKN